MATGTGAYLPALYVMVQHPCSGTLRLAEGLCQVFALEVYCIKMPIQHILVRLRS